MIYPSIDKLLTQVGSKYLLVNLVSKRVQEIKETEHFQMKDTEYKSRINTFKLMYFFFKKIENTNSLS